jgi:hypothetical protein
VSVGVLDNPLIRKPCPANTKKRVKIFENNFVCQVRGILYYSKIGNI